MSANSPVSEILARAHAIEQHMPIGGIVTKDDLRFLLAQLRAALQDTQRMDFCEQHTIQTDFAEDDMIGRELWIRSGGVNDREWELCGTGPTVRSAIDAALSSTPGGPQ